MSTGSTSRLHSVYRLAVHQVNAAVHLIYSAAATLFITQQVTEESMLRAILRQKIALGLLMHCLQLRVTRLRCDATAVRPPPRQFHASSMRRVHSGGSTGGDKIHSAT